MNDWEKEFLIGLSKLGTLELKGVLTILGAPLPSEEVSFESIILQALERLRTTHERSRTELLSLIKEARLPSHQLRKRKANPGSVDRLLEESLRALGK